MTETQPATVGETLLDRTYEDGGPDLYAALAAVQQHLPKIRKAETGKVSGVSKETGKAFSYEYSYADLASVSEQLLPLLGENGLAFTAWPRVIDGKLVLRYHLTHESGQRMSGDWPLKGGTPQQTGSEITYARRYCLCAVTGVSPDNDDDAAAAEGRRQDQRAEQQAEIDQELSHARDVVRGAWAVQFGPWDDAGNKPDEMYRAWSKTTGRAGTLGAATPGQLRAFAGYLHNMPAADAGSTPEPEPEPAPEQPADDVKVLDDARPITARQNGMLFALFEDLGWKADRQRQLEFLTSVTGRTIKSRSDLRAPDMDAVLSELEQRVAALPKEAGEA